MFIWKRFLGVLLLVMMVGCSSYGDYIKDGDLQYSRGNYEGAYSKYMHALAEKPDSEEAQMKVNLAAKQLLAEYDADAQECAQRGDFIGAITAARKAHQKFPDNPSAQKIVQFAADESAGASDGFEQEGDFATALMLDQAVAENLPPFYEEFSKRADALRLNWAGALRTTAPKAESEGRLGDALLQYAKIEALTGDPEAARKKTVLKDAVLTKFKYTVHARGNSGAVPAAVTRSITSTDAGTLNVASEVQGKPDATLRFKVARVNMGKDVTGRTESVEYQSGTKQVENPFYQSKVDNMEREERRLVDYQDDVMKYENDVSRYSDAVAKEGDTPGTSTGAEQNLSRARSSLESARRKVSDQRNTLQRATEAVRNEPQTKEEPVYSALTYEVRITTLSARTEVSGTIKHKDKRPAISINEPLKVSESDESHDAYPVANIAANPLHLPTSDELTNQLTAQAAQVVSQGIGASFESWREALLKTSMAAPTPGERTDGLVGYILTFPQMVKPEALLELKAASGIPDALEVLQ